MRFFQKWLLAFTLESRLNLQARVYGHVVTIEPGYRCHAEQLNFCSSAAVAKSDNWPNYCSWNWPQKWIFKKRNRLLFEKPVFNSNKIMVVLVVPVLWQEIVHFDVNLQSDESGRSSGFGKFCQVIILSRRSNNPASCTTCDKEVTNKLHLFKLSPTRTPVSVVMWMTYRRTDWR